MLGGLGFFDPTLTLNTSSGITDILGWGKQNGKDQVVKEMKSVKSRDGGKDGLARMGF